MRYKQCCGSLAAKGGNPPEIDVDGAAPLDVAATKEAAMAFLENGRLAEAERLFRKILAHVPQDFDE